MELLVTIAVDLPVLETLPKDDTVKVGNGLSVWEVVEVPEVETWMVALAQEDWAELCEAAGGKVRAAEAESIFVAVVATVPLGLAFALGVKV